MSNFDIEKKVGHNFYTASFKLSINVRLSEKIKDFWRIRNRFFNNISLTNVSMVSNNIKDKVYSKYE